MRRFSRQDIAALHSARREKLFEYLARHGIAAAVFEDCEERRNPAVRYFTGHPSDALFVASVSDGKGCCALIPWDENLARERAFGVKIIPYNKYERKNTKAVRETLSSLGMKGSRKKVEIPPETPYPLFLAYVDELSKDEWDVLCRKKSAHDHVADLRARKDEYEIECTKEAARVGDIIISEIERGLRESWLRTETDVALLVESELRKHGCERTGFDTLAAGPARSWAIHAFPGYTNAPWPADGLSILDFGVVCNGYTSDTTLTVAKNLSAAQEKLVQLVQKAADEALPLYRAGTPVKKAAETVDALFKKARRVMPHTLGHGIGLEIHEFPRVSAKQPDDLLFEAGMIVTLEPGLYDPALGGARLENDVLVTEGGNEVITHSKIIRV